MLPSILINLVIVLLIVQCQNNSSYENLYPNYKPFRGVSFISELRLKSTMCISGDLLKKPNDIIFIDSLYIISEPNNSFLLSIYNKEFNKIKSICKYGNGPDELTSVSNLSFNKKYLSVLDIGTQLLLLYNINSLSDSASTVLPKRIKLSQKFGVISYHHILENEDILTTNISENNTKFCFYDSSGIAIKSISYTYPIEYHDTPMPIVQEALQGKFHLKNNKLIFGTIYSDCLESYTINRDTLINIFKLQGPDLIKPEFTLEFSHGFQVMSQTNKMKWGYIKPFIDENGFSYCLYSGRPRGGNIPANRSNIIYVFDNYGAPFNKIILDKYINTFFINNHSLFAIGSSDKDDAVFKYTLE